MTTASPQKILLIDDEFLLLEQLARVLEGGGHVIQDRCLSTQAAAECIQRSRPDLVICDVYYDNQPLGIDFCRTLERERIPFYFISGRGPELILPASTDVSPLGLIFKPLDARDLLTRIEIFTQRERGHESSPLDITFRGRRHLIDQAHIFCASSDGNYCTIVLAQKRYAIISSLSALHERLGNDFIRTHKSHLVNVSFVKSYRATELTLSDGRVVPIGRSYRKAFQERMGK